MMGHANPKERLPKANRVWSASRASIRLFGRQTTPTRVALIFRPRPWRVWMVPVRSWRVPEPTTTATRFSTRGVKRTRADPTPTAELATTLVPMTRHVGRVCVGTRFFKYQRVTFTHVLFALPGEWPVGEPPKGDSVGRMTPLSTAHRSSSRISATRLKSVPVASTHVRGESPAA